MTWRAPLKWCMRAHTADLQRIRQTQPANVLFVEAQVTHV
jgi:hypothetical protein